MNTGISIASLVVSVITLAIVLMLLADNPGEPSQVELEMSRGISEAQRLEACAAIGELHPKGVNITLIMESQAGKVITETIMENRCTEDEIGWKRAWLKDAN